MLVDAHAVNTDRDPDARAVGAAVYTITVLRADGVTLAADAVDTRLRLRIDLVRRCWLCPEGDRERIRQVGQYRRLTDDHRVIRPIEREAASHLALCDPRWGPLRSPRAA